MADQNTTDMIMWFMHGSKPGGNEGKYVQGECALAVAKDDDMVEGFKSATYDEYSNFFEITDFSFGFQAEESEGKDRQAGEQRLNTSPNLKGLDLARPARIPKPEGAKYASGDFLNWRSATEEEYKSMTFGVDMDSFQFTRLIDGASPIFFKACSYSWTFKKAALVKRVSRGPIGDMNRLPVGYMRLDFEEILLKSIKWSDGEVVNETCEFTCRKFNMRYKQQKSTGDLDSTSMTAAWDHKIHFNPDRNNRTTGRR